MDRRARRQAGSGTCCCDDRSHADSAQVEKTLGTLTHFIIEPFLPHPSTSEFYICINSVREGDIVLFTHEGGVEVGDVDAKALQLLIPVGGELPDRETVKAGLLSGVVGDERKEALVDFLARLYSVYVDLHFTYLEINPLVAVEVAGKTEIFYLDMAAKLDQTAEFIAGPKWSIARDPSVFDPSRASASTGKVLADRGPPMVWPPPYVLPRGTSR